jgi:hypothetical protein
MLAPLLLEKNLLAASIDAAIGAGDYKPEIVEGDCSCATNFSSRPMSPSA